MLTQSSFLASVFEERAENLSQDELSSWTTYTARDEYLIAKLVGPGAKLLTGPRGSGKSTLLRTAYYRLLDTRDALPVYVNYSRSLALEPLFHKRADAVQLFRQWVLAKIALSLVEAFREAGVELPPWLIEQERSSRRVITAHETGALEELVGVALVAPSQLLKWVEDACLDYGAPRCVILMDDAAHAFSLEQQQEFFEIFRELRSRRVACKAAVYPGVTSYSPNFHVGHEAELLEAWSQPDDDAYLEGMRQLVTRRLPHELAAQLAEKQEIVDYLALAAFGLPRAFINMLARVFEVDEANFSKPSRARAEKAVSAQAEEMRGIFRALAKKLPRYAKFVEVGSSLERGMLDQLSRYNLLQVDAKKKAKTVALEHPIPAPLLKILGMLEYAGMLRSAGTVSRGEKGRFSRFTIHYSLLLSEGGLRLGKSFALSDAVDALNSRHPHAFARTKCSSILGHDFLERCKLEMPPCPNCHSARLTEDQKFCTRCGAELASASIYEDLLQTEINELSIPDKKKQGIASHTSLRTVQDILLDDDLQQLRSVPRIGAVWASKIKNAAEEFVGV